MKRSFVLIGTLLLLLCPSLSAADTSATSEEVQHILAIAATLSAQESALSSGTPLACAALSSKTHVKANELFVLAWGSMGAESPRSDSVVSLWAPVGTAIIQLPSSGTWTYHFKFYAKNGQTVGCRASIVVDDE